MTLLILKLLAGTIAATIATNIIIIKTSSEAVGPWRVGKWRLTTEGVLSLSALWVALVFSTGTDVLKYKGDQRTAEEQESKSEELRRQQTRIERLAAKATTDIDKANDQLKDSATTLASVAGTTTQTLGSVNTANDQLRTSAGTLNQVVERQITATATANETLGKLTETSTMVRRSSKPLRPLEFRVHLKYEYGNTSGEIRDYVTRIKSYVDGFEADHKNTRNRGQETMEKENWDATSARIRITGPGALLNLASSRVRQILASGSVGIKIRPTESETATVTNDQVAMIAHADFTTNKPELGDALTTVPQRSDLQIYINRKTGDITELFFLKRVDPLGAVFGVNSIYDFPSKWLEMSLLSPVDVADNPKITYFAYLNDSFITGGKFPESICLMANGFKPKYLRPTRDNPEGTGVAFVYQLQLADLDSAARCGRVQQ
jgi:hypothetical protein